MQNKIRFFTFAAYTNRNNLQIVRKSMFLVAIASLMTAGSIVAQQRPNVLEEIEKSGNFAPMFPFQPTHNAPDNITNVRTWTGVDDRPAGVDGFVKAEGNHFVDANGRELRFIGTQCGMTGCFPSHKQADRLAKEFTRYGINIVRMHYVSHRNPKDGYPVLNSFIEPVQLEKFDYFIAKLKENGIYVYFQLNIARKFKAVNGIVNAGKLPKYKNGVDNVNPRMIELQKMFHKEILDHVNPYTGIAYKDETCISMMEIANENSIIHSWFSPAHKFSSLVEPYKSEFIHKWNAWLVNKYGNTENLKKAWGVGTESDYQWPEGQSLEIANVDWPYDRNWTELEQRAVDFIDFLSDIEYSYFTDMYGNLKNNLGIRQCVTGTQVGYGLNRAQAGMDYCDNHCYWCHPAFPTGKWNNKHFTVRNESIVNSWGHPASAFTKVARQRILGKPYTVSEFDIPNLNFYCAEADIMMAALGAFQNWSGLIQFSWILDTDFDRTHVWPQFDMCSAPQKLVHFPACYAMFVRGDVRKGSDDVVFAMPSSRGSDVRKIADKKSSSASADNKTQLMNSLPLAVVAGSDVAEAPELFSEEGRTVIRTDKDVPAHIKEDFLNKQMKSSTGELTWDWQQKGAGYFTVDTRDTKVFTGFVKGRSFTYKGMNLIPGKTRLDWMTLSLTLASPSGISKPDNLLRPGKYLLAATGLVQNTDMKIVEVAKKPSKLSISEPEGGKLGTGPVLCEGINAKLVFAGLKGRVKCWALDPDGNRIEKVPVTSTRAGDAILEIDPKYRTVWYEMIVEEIK